MRRRWMLGAAGGAAVLVVLAVLVAVGRWEHDRWAREQVRGMERIGAAIGPLRSRSLVGYRVLPAFDCLVYRRDANPYALELCVDRAGRVVEAIDRRGVRTYYSLRADPSSSTFRVDRTTVDRLLRMMRAPAS